MHGSLIFSAVLAASLRFAPAPAGASDAGTDHGTMIVGGPRAPTSSAATDSGRWLRRELGTHPQTSWRSQQRDLIHGGQLLIVQELWAGVPISGARLVLRFGADGRLRQVIGRSLAPSTPWHRRDRRAATSALASMADSGAHNRALRWWVEGDRPRLAQVVDTPLHHVDGIPTQTREMRALDDGSLLASESLIAEAEVSLTGWAENPLTTPEPVSYLVELIDADPLVLEDDIVRVLHCAWSESLEGCDPIAFPTATAEEPFPDTLPTLADAAVHADPEDPYASIQFMQLASRFEKRLAAWGWDPYAWEQIDCTWQEVPLEDCRLIVHTNVMRQDDDGVFPFSGGYYSRSSGIFMGQGKNADISYDGDIIIHEIGHHITASAGSPDPTELVDDGGRRRVDRSAINEGTSDFFARMMGQNDRIYDYYSAVEPGLYVDHRVRDVSIPFRCPENVVGQVHMEGRRWATGLVNSHKILQAEGYADEDTFPTIFLGALPAIRTIPKEQREQFADASAILIDEVNQALGPEAAALVEAELSARGLLECDHVRNLADDPKIKGTYDPDDPLDARFMVFTSYKPGYEPELYLMRPPAPAVQQRVELTEEQQGVILSYRPGLWRPARAVDEVEFALAALVNPGLDGVTFSRNDEDNLIDNDAQFEFYAQPDPEAEAADPGDRQWDEIIIDGLTPGEPYSIALVSMSGLSGDNFVIEDMEWSFIAAEDDEDDEDDTGGGGSEDTGSDGQTGGQTDDQKTVFAASDEQGCACSQQDRPGNGLRGAAGLLLGLLGLAIARRRRRPLSARRVPDDAQSR